MNGELLASPAPDFSDPLGLLGACHQRMHHFCNLLQQLAELPPARQLETPAANAAGAVLRYFEIAAPLHHQDEEMNLFPLLDDEPALAQLISQLQQQHRLLESSWEDLQPMLAALAAAQAAPLQASAAAPFIQTLREHLALEDQHILPQARARLTQEQLEKLAAAMAERRRPADLKAD